MNLIQRRFFSTAALLLICCLPVRAVELYVPTLINPTPKLLTTYDAVMPLSASSNLTASPLGTNTRDLGSFQIVLNPNVTLAGNLPALAAFNRAAAQWESRISDPITVNIDANLSALGTGIIGQAGSTLYGVNYSGVNGMRAALIADSSDESDDAIVSLLPSTFTATMPVGFSLNGSVAVSQANLKALGGVYAGSDGTITFSTNFNFDYDNSDGVTPGFMDFETVAAHEIGHVLGFTSWVDEIDADVQANAPGATYLTTLDLFRFADSANTSLDPIDASTFATATRNLVPGAVGITDFGDNAWGIGNEFKMSTGVTQGDGRQASHWKDDLSNPANYIGMMDPTLSFGTIQQISEADFRALDLIGWDISIAPIPEPSTYALGAVGLGAVYLLRRKRVGTAV